MKIEVEKLSVDFECPKCEAIEEKVSLGEIIETGCPMCAKCEEEMEYTCAHLEQMEGVTG
jgi:transcription elongation factor Elf1